MADDTRVTHPRRGIARALPLVCLLAVTLPASAVATGASPAGTTPSDQYWSVEWGLEQSSNVDINAPEAWKLSTGKGVTVAVVDTGVDAQHPDLAAHIRSDGYDFVDQDAHPDDPDGHGTAVAGIIAAISNNGIGISGVAPDAMILPLRAVDGSSDSSTVRSDVLAAFDRAGAMGVRVVNGSFATPPLPAGAREASTDAQLFQAVFAEHPNTLYIVAAGNDDNDNDSEPVFPCDTDAENLICVGASTRSEDIASFSNTGSDSVDLFAPGDQIFSTWITSPYYTAVYGTSAAAAFVSGEAALLFSRVPSLTPEAVKAVILDTSKRVDRYANASRTGGRADAYAALLEASRDTDGDSVPDLVDACPTAVGAAANGCDPVVVGPTPTPSPTPATSTETPNVHHDPPRVQPKPQIPRLRTFKASASRCKANHPCRRTATVKLIPDRAALVSLRVERKVCSRGRCHWSRVLTRAFTSSTRGVSLTVRGKGASSLPRGSYRVVAVVSSSAGAAKPVIRTFTVR
jgi:subtilisin family serine protease